MFNIRAILGSAEVNEGACIYPAKSSMLGCIRYYESILSHQAVKEYFTDIVLHWNNNLKKINTTSLIEMCY